jgi:hypothetical protein
MKTPIHNEEDWVELAKIHSAPLFPFKVWNKSLMIAGVPLLPMIRTSSQPL